MIWDGAIRLRGCQGSRLFTCDPNHLSMHDEIVAGDWAGEQSKISIGDQSLVTASGWAPFVTEDPFANQFRIWAGN